MTGAPADDPDDRTARLYAIVARARRRAVVFRRGPNKRVRLLLWNLDSDTLVGGQWFKGRIYERRCDLDPDGTMLVYFAASFRGPLQSWTAVSRPPYLTALALWRLGDTYSGGGLFPRQGLLELNHHAGPDGALRLLDGYQVPPGLAVVPMFDDLGYADDGLLEAWRLERDGWTIDGPQAVKPAGPGATLDVSTHALGDGLGQHGMKNAVIRRGSVQRDLGRVDWADTDHNGDILYAANGCLHRIRAGNLMTGDAALVADLNGMRFMLVRPPPAALR